MRRAGPTRRWPILAALPLCVSMALGAFALRQPPPPKPDPFCREAQTLYTDLTRGYPGNDPLHDPKAAADRLSGIDVRGLVASLPASLASQGGVLRRDLPVYVSRLRALKPGDSVISVLPPALVGVYPAFSVEVQRRCG